MKTLRALAALAAALVASLVLAQAPRPTPPPLSFGTGIEIFNLTLSVTDPGGHYVTDLKFRWLAVTETRVVESEDPVNYRWVGEGNNGKAERVKDEVPGGTTG